MTRRGVLLVGLAALALPLLAATDAEKNQSDMMNAKRVAAEEGTLGGVKVLFLGNSITLHESLPKIGWTNAWGMAASAKEKDYVHLVACGIEAKTGRKAEMRVLNLASFERNYRTWDAERELASLACFSPDYLIVALGENVPNLKTQSDARDYGAAFDRLIGLFQRGGKRPHGVVRGVFWPNAAKDEQMRRVADARGLPFVRADVAELPGMKATGLFWHVGVQNHPGDRGMAEIARRILAALFPEPAARSPSAHIRK